jgi:hypothetical protein
MTYNFQTEMNNIKLLMEFKTVIKTVILIMESILRNAKQLQHAPFMAHKMSEKYWTSLLVFSNFAVYLFR